MLNPNLLIKHFYLKSKSQDTSVAATSRTPAVNIFHGQVSSSRPSAMKTASSSNDNDDGGKVPSLRAASTPDFGLFLACKRLLHAPRRIVDTRVIVVGASTTAFAFLNELMNVKGVRMNNLVLVR